MISLKELYAYWDKRFVSRVNWNNKKIVDYGCGGGYLYQKISPIDRYVGLDISQRSLDFAEKNNGGNIYSEYRLLPIYLDAYAHYDILVCQAVIHHFPSIEHLDGFLENVNRSGINELVLQHRHRDDMLFQPDNPGNACWTREPYISGGLCNYELEWQGDIDQTSKGQYLKYKRKS